MSTVSFYDNYVPLVKDAQYTITVTQDLTVDVKQTDADGGNPAVTSPPQAPATQTVILRGPRFSVDPADVQRAFPPSGGTGVYDQFLPMIVLSRRALPWERDLDVSVPDPSAYPWVALLVFDAGELLVPGGGDPPPPGSQQSPTRTASVPLGDAVDGTFNGVSTAGPPPGTLGAKLTLADDEDPTQINCNVIEVSAATFDALVPGTADLKLLAHVREVTTDDKVTSAAADTWFSTVIANRFAPSPAQGATTGRSNVVHLVSLEGFGAWLGDDGPTVGSQYERVRLVSLYSWAFTSMPDPAEDFEQLTTNLVSTASDGGSGLLLRIPAPSWTVVAPPTAAPAMGALTRVQDGYAALSYTAQSGEQTFAWYRGPFAATPTAHFLENAPPGTTDNPEAPTTASEALVYDPQTGIFDVSYALAFQTGRSLALASLPFATALLQYRRTANALVDQVLELMRTPLLAAKLRADGILDASGNLTPTGVDDLAELLATGITPNALVDVLATELYDGIAQQVGQTGGFTTADAQTQPSDPVTPPPVVPADLSTLMQDPTVVALLTQVSGLQTGAPPTGQFQDAILPDLIVSWLARTALLEGVPFSNLVPDERMLPVESVRFFYVDPNWIDALIDGALSAGIQTSRDSLLQQILRDPLHDAVDAALLELRDTMRGVPVTPPTALGSMTGFILRSALVAGWPGLEVRAYAAGEEPMKPLRLDRVAPGVMIGIYPDVPVRLEFDEPSEGLVFGIEDDGVSLRYLPGTEGVPPAGVGEVVQLDGKPVWLTPAQIAALRRSGPLDQGPISISGLAAALQSALPGQAPVLGPAALAVEMVKVPEQMLFLPVVSA
jgi:hypothetical protein